MRIAYIYQEGINLQKVNIFQSANMVHEFGNICSIDWYRGFSKLKLKYPSQGLTFIQVINLGLGQKKWFVFEKISRLVFCLHTLILLFINKPDFIFTRDFGFILFLSKLPNWLKPKRPLVFESHKLFFNITSKVSFEQERKAYKNVHLFVVVSEGIKQDLASIFQINPDLIFVEPNGIDPRLFPKINSKIQKPDQLNIVYAGSLENWKGPYIILDAAKLLVEINCHIHVFVSNSMERKWFQSEIEKRNLSTVITCYEPKSRTELFTLFQKMDIGLIPNIELAESMKYTSPIKLFEYAFAGLMIVASDILPIKELSKKGFGIEIFEAGSASSLSKHIQQIKKNGIDLKLIQSNKLLVQNYTWEKRAKRIIDRIKEHSEILGI